MKKIIGIIVAVIVVVALGFAGWLYLGRDPMSFTGGSTVAMAAGSFVMFAWAVSKLGGYSPFLYFQF